jgi:hypothetical protein
MNDFLSELARLLDVVREHREPTPGDLRRVFATACGVELPPS